MTIILRGAAIFIPVIIFINAALIHNSFKIDRELGYSSSSSVVIPDTLKKPMVSLEKNIQAQMTILFVSDTTPMNGLTKIFQKRYGELYPFIYKNGLKPGKAMAFFLNYNDPVAMETAVEVDRIPAQLSGKIKVRVVEGGAVVVAHYTGPYEEIVIGYNAITRWLNENNIEPKGKPFEVYLNNPASVKDKYDLKTDIYQFVN